MRGSTCLPVPFARPPALIAECALPGNAHVGNLLQRQIEYAQYRPVMPDKGDINRELSGFRQEFLGAIKGIHQPVLAPAEPPYQGLRRRLL